MVARRVAAVSSKYNPLSSPTGQGAPIENNGENSGLSNVEKYSGSRCTVRSEHKRTARALEFALALGDADAWADFAGLAAHHLTEAERAGLAFAALVRLAREQAERVTGLALAAAGDPLPVFLGEMDEARLWASLATRTERKAYTLAAFEALGEADRAAFLQHVSGRAAA